MTPADKRAMESKRQLVDKAMEFLKTLPGFARAQAQSIRRQTEWEAGLSEKEKQLASLPRLLTLVRLMDIRAEVYLPLVNDLPSQEAYAAIVSAIMDQAWEDYIGLSVYFAPPMREDPNYKMIAERGRHWIAASYDRADMAETATNQNPTPSPTTSESVTVFISYSWDDEPHKQWVLDLTNRLRDDGIDAIIDQTHLELGGDTPQFMETSIRESRYVLVVCTEKYKGRFDHRIGGAGYEGHIITAQMLKDFGLKKFIPLLRRGDWESAMPTALEGIFGVDLRKDSVDEYKKLVTHLHGKKFVRPIGPHPDWLHEQAGGEKRESPTEVKGSESNFLPPDDLRLISAQQDSGLVIWLENHTLDPMENCRLKLANLQQFSSNHKDFQRNPFRPEPLLSAQTINASRSSNEAISFARFQDTQKRDLLVFGRFPYNSPVILMAEILIDGGGKSRTETKFISWVPGGDPEFIDDPRTAKPETVPSPFITHPEYLEQRKRLPDSEIMKNIWTKPRWCIWSRPEDFKKARFLDLNHCAQFVALASVRSQNTRCTQYPWFSPTPEYGQESIAGQQDFDDTEIRHLERWVLFRSGQFVHNLALDNMPILSGRTHVLEISNMTAAAFEFIGRMADKKLISGRTAISFEFHNVEGRQLTWPKDPSQQDDFVDRRSSWCQQGDFTVDTAYPSADLIDRRRELALETSLRIYSHFGWNDPPVEELRKNQQARFGPPVHI